MNSLKENGMKLRRWRPEEPATFNLAATAEDGFKASTFALFGFGCPLFSDWEFFGAVNISMSVRCRFKGFEPAIDASDLSWDALGVVDAVVSTSAR